MDSRERLELLNHIGFLYFFEQRIATQATSKWSDQGDEIEAAHYFDDLFSRVLGAGTIAMSHYLVHEQPTIAREEGSTPRAFASPDNFGVVDVQSGK